MRTLTAAAVQMTSNADPESNLERARALVLQACEREAELVALPEFFVCLSSDEGKKIKAAEDFGKGLIQDFLSNLAAECGIHLVGGSIPLRSDIKGKVYNSSLLYGPSGDCIARYDKIHLFRYRGASEAYDESVTMAAGSSVVAHDCPFGRVGMSVCYDLRFPEMFRAMGRPDIIAAPTAFTVPTGRDHWELLVRARAVENQCYVVAPCQSGEHDGGRRTWGHSMIANPWGDVLSVKERGEGVCIAVLDGETLAKCRERLPALDNRMM